MYSRARKDKIAMYQSVSMYVHVFHVLKKYNPRRTYITQDWHEHMKSADIWNQDGNFIFDYQPNMQKQFAA